MRLSLAKQRLVKMKKLIFPFLLLISSCATAPQSVATICYLPFDRETFGPVDRKLIEKYKCTDTDYTDALYKTLSKYLSNQNQIVAGLANSQFDEKRVRLKFVGKEDTYYVDANGEVSVGSHQYRLSDDNLHAIAKMLAYAFDYND